MVKRCIHCDKWLGNIEPLEDGRKTNAICNFCIGEVKKLLEEESHGFTARIATSN